MTHAMIWTFGVLVFLLLLIVIGRWSPRGRESGRYRQLSEQSVQTGQETVTRLDQLRAQVSDLQGQVSALQRILNDV